MFLKKTFNLTFLKGICKRVDEIKKNDGTHLKYLHHSGDMLKNFTSKKSRQKIRKLKNLKIRLIFLKILLTLKKFSQRKNGLKSSINFGHLVRRMHSKN